MNSLDFLELETVELFFSLTNLELKSKIFKIFLFLDLEKADDFVFSLNLELGFFTCFLELETAVDFFLYQFRAGDSCGLFSLELIL